MPPSRRDSERAILCAVTSQNDTKLNAKRSGGTSHGCDAIIKRRTTGQVGHLVGNMMPSGVVGVG